MKTKVKSTLKVAVYASHEQAVEALKKLEAEQFPMNDVSLIGKAELMDEHEERKSMHDGRNLPAYIGIGGGTVLGLLAGLGVFAVPGFGFLYGAGAVVGTIGGFDLGLVSGGIVTLLATAGIHEDEVDHYAEHLNQGNFIVLVNGPEEEAEKAERILHTEGTHLQLSE